MIRVMLCLGLVLGVFVAPAISQAPPTAATSVILVSDGSLTNGIPGEGKLTTEQIEKWLADPRNHEALAVKLPLGLSAGQTAVFIPADNPLTRAKIELGRQLYFDTRLSSDGTVSCASCHNPDSGYAKQTQFGEGIGGQKGGRNSPASYNRLLSKSQFWDGRAASLEEQAKGPIANPIEMGFSHKGCVDCLGAVEGYKLQFDQIFPDEGLTIDTVAKAIASFERTLITGPSPADYFEPRLAFEKQFKDDLTDVEGFKADDPVTYERYVAIKKASDEHPINDAAKRGRELFFSQKANCTTCHVGANFTDEQYHNLGVGMEREQPDLGRFDQTKQDKDRGAFKTPTIRNVVLTAPYMHDGSQKTLEEVVEWYDKGGHPNPHLSDKIKKPNLTKQEKSDLVEYMKALTGSFPKVRTDRLPQ